MTPQSEAPVAAAVRTDPRKVVQITEVYDELVVLCNDGSIWTQRGDEWFEVAPPPGCGGGR